MKRGSHDVKHGIPSKVRFGVLCQWSWQKLGHCL